MDGRLDPAVARARLLVRGSLADLTPGDTVLVGLSGGADSLALAAAVAYVAPRAGLRWGAVVVDHGLQAGSATVAAAAAEQARGLGAEVVRVVPAASADDSGAGPEATARAGRRAALTEQATETGAATVLLAHTRDDQAETVLLGLARGSGARSLAGMRPVAGLLRRPFLELTRSETEQVCAAQGLVPWTDPHNSDPAYARSRARSAVLPVLEEQLGPGIGAALARTADLLRDDADLLDTLATELLEAVRLPDRPAPSDPGPQRPADPVELPVDALAAAPRALRRRVLRQAAVAAGAAGPELAALHVDAVDALVTSWHGQRGVDLPGRVRAARADGVLRLATAPRSDRPGDGGVSG